MPRRVITERGLDNNIFCGPMHAYHISHRDGSKVLGLLTRRSNKACEEAPTATRVLEDGDRIIPEGYGRSWHEYVVRFRKDPREDPYVMVHCVEFSEREDSKEE